MSTWLRFIHAGIPVLILWSNAFGQPTRFQFKHLTPDDGLSSSSVTSLLQDHKGFMWIGTYYGLNRYDGYKFEVFNNISADSASLPNNLVWTIFEDRENNILIGTSEGLSTFNRKKNNFKNYMQDKSSPLSAFNYDVHSICEDSLGNLWLATSQGLVYFDRINNNAVCYTMDPNNPHSLSYSNVENVFIDSKNNLWVSTRKGLNLFQPKTKSFQHITSTANGANELKDTFFTKIVEDKEGTLWFGTYGAGLYCRTAKEKNGYSFINIRHNPKDNQSISADRVQSMFVDTNGDVWVGTENGGLNIFQRTTGTFSHYRTDELDPNSLNNESINSIYKDHTGNYWIGTFSGGINISKKNSGAILDFRKLPGVATSLSQNSVTSFLEDGRGRIWLGTDGGGLDLFDPKTSQFTHYNSKNTNLSSDAVLSLVEDADHKLWLGTWAGGLIRFDEETKSFRSYTTNNSSISDNNINSIVLDRYGDLWLGSFQNGLIHYQRGKNEFTNYSSKNSGISISIISVLELAPDGRILVGTASGFNIFDPEKKQFSKYRHAPGDIQSISSNGILSFAIENDTSIWIGTDNGLNRFNPRTELFTRFSSQDGLPDNVIKGLVFDTSGNLWVSSNKGLCRCTLKSGKYKIFMKSDGLQSNEFNSKSILRLNNNRLLFGGTSGFNLIYPERIRENQSIPQVLMTDLLIFNTPAEIDVQGSPLHTHISETDQLTLSYQQSVFTLAFAALDFTVPEKNQYAFIMEGFETEWNYVGTKRTATYTNLDPGEYHFRVKASNNDGIWNETGTSLKIIITPPFWKKWWFRLIWMVLVFNAVIWSLKKRTARILSHNRELQQHVLMRTSELEAANNELESFAYSISHNLQAPLRAINGFSHILIEDNMKSLNEAGRHACEVIFKETKHMGQLIEDFLSLSRSSYTDIHISLINMETMVHSVFDEIMGDEHDHRIDFRVASLPSAYGDPALIQEVWVNLLSNAIKFSSKKERSVIEVNYRQDGQKTVYSVQDNGAGFEMKYADKLFEVFQRLHAEKEFEGTGVGLAIVKRIINRHGGEIWAEGELNKGAIFYFTIAQKGETH